MRKNNEVKAWVNKAEQDFEGACILASKRKKPVPDLIRALKAIKEVRKFFALHLPGISQTR